MATITQRIGIIGCGAMGGAIARGLVQSGLVDGSSLLLVDHHPGRAQQMSAELGATECADVAQLAAAAPDCVILAVKPQVMEPVVQQLLSGVSSCLIISIAAGKPLSWYVGLGCTAGELRCVRVMPNLPVSVRSGASAITAVDASTGKPTATDDDVELTTTLFAALGSAFVLREDQLDAEGAVIGCAPAYFALMIDALTRAGVRVGMPCAAAREMACATMAGTAQQLLDSGQHPRAYMDAVTSPGGTTAAALKSLEPLLMEGANQAVDAALTRTAQLASPTPQSN